MGALSQLSADVAQAERLKPGREGLSADELFLLDIIMLPADRLAAVSHQLMDAAGAEHSADVRADLSRRLLAIDAVGELKFPERWVSERRAA